MHDLEVIGSNGDATFPAAGGPAPGAGALLASVTFATGRAVRCAGKPEPAMFEEARRALGTGRCLVVGDRLDSDIAGGAAAGMDTALVLSGSASDADVAAWTGAAADLRPARRRRAGRPARGARSLNGTRRVSRSGLLALCERLAGQPGRSVYVGGEVLLEADDEVVRIVPPFPLEHEAGYDRVETGPLSDLLLRPRSVALCAVRLGGFGAAFYRDEQVVAARAGTRFVKNRNRKGGSSSGRFARRRVEQANDLHERAARMADEVLGPHVAAADHLVLAGDRFALDAATAQSSALRALLPRRIPFAYDVPEPRRKTFDALAREVWSGTVTRLPPGER